MEPPATPGCPIFGYRPPAARRHGDAVRATLAALAVLGAVAFGLLTLLMIGMITGPGGLLVGVFLALLPVPLWVLLVLWLDRYEPEPPWTLAAAFAWGATVAVFFALIFNSVSELIFAIAAGSRAAERLSAVLSAPPVEETAKGLALLILYWWKKDEFDGIVDGVVYAAMVGLGFAMTENFLYYGKSLQHGELLLTFILRGVISPLSHPLFTSMIGIGLGWARQSDRVEVKALAPIGGWVLAVGLHFAWNLSAGSGALLLLTYAFVMFPALIGVLLLARYSLRHEEAVMLEQLGADVRAGLLTQADLEALCSLTGRWRRCNLAYGIRGADARNLERRLQQTASEVAFSRWRIARGITAPDEAVAELEAAYAELLRVCRIE